jgi:hypothetical protein
MAISIFRMIIFAFAATTVCACATTTGELTLLAPDYKDAPIDVLARDVEGEDCVYQWTFILNPSYGKAIANALAKIPRANVMQDVSFEFQDRFFWYCAWVKGNAGRFR